MDNDGMSFGELPDDFYDDHEVHRAVPYCIHDVRCFLCQLKYEENDVIIPTCDIMDQDHDGWFAPIEYNYMKKKKKNDWDHEPPRYHMCGKSSCGKNGVTSYTVHQYCLYLVPVGSRNQAKYASAMAYSYRPSHADERLRVRRLVEAASRKLQRDILKGLPNEICDKVTAHLVQELAAVSTGEMLSLLNGKLDHIESLDLSKDMYLAYRQIEGVTYVHWLSNDNLDGKGAIFYRAQDGQQVHSLQVAFDHLGVRRVFTEKPPVAVSIGAGSQPYWMQIKPDVGKTTVYCKPDGLKLRSIITGVARDWRHDEQDPIAWPMLHHSYQAIDSWGKDIEYFGPRMTRLECRASNIKGFCAHLSQDPKSIEVVMVDLHENTGQSQEIAWTYKSFKDLDWMYMPLDKDEHVEDIWLVRSKRSRRRGLMFVTNTGRASMFGQMLDPHDYPEFYRVFSRSCGSSSQLYLSAIKYHWGNTRLKAIGRDTNLDQLPYSDCQGFVRQIKPEWNPYPPMLTATGSPWSPTPDLYYFSKCRLDNISHITCCVDQFHRHNPIIGMMMHYKGGGRACVGMYRHDWAHQSPLRVKDPNSAEFTITIGRDESNMRVYITAASIGRTVVGNRYIIKDRRVVEGEQMHIPWHGWLEWWFSTSYTKYDVSYCQLTHVA